ncbi:MAG: (p)ppGpp synthetase [Candidatus Levybacteria bacterium CG10_big_fil_rev_8_21_14_0_10_36_7]|nr:MAG: (p)ppGpp synthetase [Candidatus Levybacteria bacterium CG10_big_fil_rev_8_21_14_0_10_36_7]
MAFAKVPKISKSRVNLAGKVLAENKPNGLTIENATSITEAWRACHAYPINTFQATLRRKLKKFSNDPLVAQRLKRMPTIIEKLHRFPKMQLARMQDIGGVRAILDSVHDIYILAGEYKDKSRFTHELVGEKDYIESPRDEDGYRSLHLIYKYDNPQAKEYNGLLLELQIRTRLQHSWATAVETMGTFLGQALKSRLGDKEWLEFFALVSSAFASIENTKLLPKHKNWSQKEIFKAVAKMNEELKVLEKISGYSVAVHTINKRGTSEKGWSYHLIVLNSMSERPTIQIKAYKRGSIKQATDDYAKIEEQIAKGQKIEAVLVSAGPLSTLRQAYPNFFLDIKDFVRRIESIIAESKK